MLLKLLKSHYRLVVRYWRGPLSRTPMMVETGLGMINKLAEI